jgi:hypothetical protein
MDHWLARTVIGTVTGELARFVLSLTTTAKSKTD